MSSLSGSSIFDQCTLPSDALVNKPKVVRKRKVKEEVPVVKVEEKKVKSETPVSAKKLRSKEKAKKNPLNKLSSIEPPPQNDADNRALSNKYNITLFEVQDDYEEQHVNNEIILHVMEALLQNGRL